MSVGVVRRYRESERLIRGSRKKYRQGVETGRKCGADQGSKKELRPKLMGAGFGFMNQWGHSPLLAYSKVSMIFLSSEARTGAALAEERTFPYRWRYQ